MLSPTQVATMLSLQAGMNAKVDPDWVQSRYPYLRAVVIEAAEAIEHHGWKWWKKQDKDLAQLQMELIDIWHFLLSEMLLEQDGDLAATQAVLQPGLDRITEVEAIAFDGEEVSLASLDLLNKLELLIALSARRRIVLPVFGAIMADCGLDWLELYRQYVGKNVLNFFRQDNGYKEGSYQKMWQGREDNEYLVEIMGALNPQAPDFQEQIYAALRAAYPG